MTDTQAPERNFCTIKNSDFVVALSNDEETKVGAAYRVVSVWGDANGGVGITAE